MKHKINIFLIALSILLVVCPVTNVYAQEDYYTFSYPEFGVENIEIPSYLGVITRDESYNTKFLLNNSDIKEIRSFMSDADIYIWAISHSCDYEINVAIVEMDYEYNLGDFEGLSSEELKKEMEGVLPSSVSDLEVSYLKIDDTPTVRLSAYLQSQDEYVTVYLASTVVDGKCYAVRATNYSFGYRITYTMESELTHIIKAMKLNQPQSVYNSSSYLSTFADGLVVKFIGAALSGAILFLIFYFVNRVKKKVNSKSKETELTKVKDDAVVDRRIESLPIINSQPKNASINDIQFCPYCGTKLATEAEFCHKCGKASIR